LDCDWRQRLAVLYSDIDKPMEIRAFEMHAASTWGLAAVHHHTAQLRRIRKHSATVVESLAVANCASGHLEVAKPHTKSTTVFAGATVGDQHVDQFEKATHTRCASAFRGAFRDGTPNHAAIEAPPIEV
jgi:hypothetical protein